jgi:hypothetical protein
VGEDIAEVFLQNHFGLNVRNVSKRNADYDLEIFGVSKEEAKKRKTTPDKMRKKLYKELYGCARKEILTVEVKFDEAAARYGNIFVEIFFDEEKGVPGTAFKCKADLLVWVIPGKKKFDIYILKRAELLAWLFQYILKNKKTKLKTPGISPQARGLPVPIKEIKKSFACSGEFEFNLQG